MSPDVYLLAYAISTRNADFLNESARTCIVGRGDHHEEKKARQAFCNGGFCQAKLHLLVHLAGHGLKHDLMFVPGCKVIVAFLGIQAA